MSHKPTVRDEANNFLNVFLTRDFWSLGSPFLHVVGFLVGLSLYQWIMLSILPVTDCFTACFQENATTCCPLGRSAWLLLGCTIPYCILASFISTRLTKRNKFRTSGMVTGVSIVVVSLVAFLKGPSLGFVLVADLILFFGNYSGYRLAFIK